MLIKKYFINRGINDIEVRLTDLKDFIDRKAFTIAGICKKLQISNLPIEIINNIISYLDGAAWGLKVKKSEVIDVSDELNVLGYVEDLGSAEAPAG